MQPIPLAFAHTLLCTIRPVCHLVAWRKLDEVMLWACQAADAGRLQGALRTVPLTFTTAVLQLAAGQPPPPGAQTRGLLVCKPLWPLPCTTDVTHRASVDGVYGRGPCRRWIMDNHTVLLQCRCMQPGLPLLGHRCAW